MKDEKGFWTKPVDKDDLETFEYDIEDDLPWDDANPDYWEDED